MVGFYHHAPMCSWNPRASWIGSTKAAFVAAILSAMCEPLDAWIFQSRDKHPWMIMKDTVDG